MTPVPVFALLAALALGIVLEFFFHATWNKTYFRMGIPLYRRRIPIASGMPHIAYLRNHCQDGDTAGIVFEKISPHEIAFRRNLDPMSHPSTLLTHGVIRTEEEAIIITAYLDWYLLAIPLLFFTSAWLLALGALSLPLAYHYLLSAFDMGAYSRLEQVISTLTGASA